MSSKEPKYFSYPFCQVETLKTLKIFMFISSEIPRSGYLLINPCRFSRHHQTWKP